MQLLGIHCSVNVPTNKNTPWIATLRVSILRGFKNGLHLKLMQAFEVNQVK
jgi:hypothetical protein